VSSQPPRLARVLGFWQVTASGVGIIVGAGIYVLIGAATERAGAAVWLSFLLAGGVSALTALSYAELASMFPGASAEYGFTRRALPQPVPFLVGWVMIAGLVVAAATVSLGFGRYFREFVNTDVRVSAVGLIAALTMLMLLGIRWSAVVTVGLSLVQVGGLVFIIAIGIPHVGDMDLAASEGSAGVLGAAALVFFAFIGFDEVITLGEETRDPAQTIPRALLAALALSTTLYVLVAITAVSVLGAPALAASERPLTTVAEHVLGDAAVRSVAVVALLSTTSTTLMALTAASRMTYGMAREGALPSSLAHVGRRSRAPDLAVVIAAAVALAFALTGDLTTIAGATDSAVYTVFLAVNATLLILRWRSPGAARPVRSPGRIGRVAVLPPVAIAATVTMMVYSDRDALLLGAGIAGSGLLAWMAMAIPRRGSVRRSL
jgi:APA family basic amino acid/polyamine antiporter